VKRILIVLSVFFALVAANVSYGALAPFFVTHPETQHFSDRVEIVGTESLDQPARSIILTMAAEKIALEQAHEEEESDEEEKGEEDEEKDSEGPDRLWDCCKLG
jgi:hypothetical protein